VALIRNRRCDAEGSEFVVLLPIEISADAPPSVDRPAPASRSGLRILVADDNEDSREMLKILLSLEGHTVAAAADGHEALEAVTTFNPDAAVLDVSMPGLNGYNLARKIRESEANGKMLLIALSGLGQPEDKSSAIEAGFDQHFTKPIEMNTLLRVLGQRFP
jgi:CheY-like chemotaxis protein